MSAPVKLPPAVVAAALKRVPNEPLRERFLAIEARGVKRSALALLLAHACGWDEENVRSGRGTKSTGQVRGVLLALGIEGDRWGAHRQVIRAYRADSMNEALDRIEAKFDEVRRAHEYPLALAHDEEAA